MAVCTKDQFTRTDIILDHNLMADTFSFPEINIMFFCKISHLLLRCCCFRAVRWYIMIHDKHQLACICNVRIFQFIVIHINRKMCGSIITHETIKFNCMDISRFYAVNTCCRSNNLFCNCHSHFTSPPCSEMRSDHPDSKYSAYIPEALYRNMFFR